MHEQPQSTSPYHLHYILTTQTRDQIHTLLSIGQLHPTHPSYHRPPSTLEFSCIIHLHGPSFATIYQNTLYNIIILTSIFPCLQELDSSREFNSLVEGYS